MSPEFRRRLVQARMGLGLYALVTLLTAIAPLTAWRADGWPTALAGLPFTALYLLTLRHTDVWLRQMLGRIDGSGGDGPLERQGTRAVKWWRGLGWSTLGMAVLMGLLSTALGRELDVMLMGTYVLVTPLGLACTGAVAGWITETTAALTRPGAVVRLGVTRRLLGWLLLFVVMDVGALGIALQDLSKLAVVEAGVWRTARGAALGLPLVIDALAPAVTLWGSVWLMRGVVVVPTEHNAGGRSVVSRRQWVVFGVSLTVVVAMLVALRTLPI